MAFLKETERSLKWYFIVVGVLATIGALSNLGEASKIPSRSLVVALAIWVPPLVHLVLAPAFLVAGINLKRALESGAPRTKLLVKIAAAFVVVDALLHTAALASLGVERLAEVAGERVLWHVLLPLLILWYIHASLRRLADESRRRVVDAVGSKFG